MLSSVNKETGELSQVAGKQATADKIFYDNSKTGIPASNVQDAIDKSARIFYGTRAEWNQLTTEEKKAYDYAAFSDGGVDTVEQKYYLFISDSYDDPLYGRFTDRIATKLGLTSEQWDSRYQGGAAFYNNIFHGMILDWYQTNGAEAAKKVTDIVLIGGINDFRTDGVTNYSDLPSVNDFLVALMNGILAVNNQVTTNFPNAVIHYCPVGHAFEDSSSLNGRGIASRRYCLSWIRDQMGDDSRYIQHFGIEYSLQNREYMYTDDLHPNTVGCNVIARNVKHALTSGNVFVKCGPRSVTPTGGSYGAGLTFTEYMLNDNMYLKVNGELMTSAPITFGNSAFIDIGEVDLHYIQSVSETLIDVQLETDNGVKTIKAGLYYNATDHHAYIRNATIGPNSWSYGSVNWTGNMQISANFNLCSLDN